MRKASGITLSIFLMLIVLAVLLGYTAYFIDQVTLKPVVLMRDTEVSLRCFLVLSNMIGGEYLREGEPVPERSLREKLVLSYNIENFNELYVGSYDEAYNDALKIMFGVSEIAIKNEDTFLASMRSRNNPLPLVCSARIYGPAKIGMAGVFSTTGVSERLNELNCQIFPESCPGDELE